MKKAVEAVVLAFKDITKFSNLKISILSAIVVILFWGGVGVVFWDTFINISSKLVEYVPFSLIKANGAWMILAFSWFQATLLTFAIVYTLFGSLIINSVSKERYTFYSILTILISAIFWAIVWFANRDFIYLQITKLLTWLPFETLEKSIAALLVIYFLYNLIIVSLVFISSIFSKLLIKHIKFEHHDNELLVKGTTFRSIKYTIKDSIIFIILSIATFPLLFIPVVNILVQIILWIWLVKDTMSYDAISLLYKDEHKELIKNHKVAIYFISFVIVLFNFLPLFNIFGPFFGEIAMFYYFKSLKA